MSDTAPQKPQQDQSSGSGLTAVSRHPCISDPIASKRVCFYKSGDPQFSGLRLVINSRTFKTFDALLDSLSKKVPLPFGVRNITTPRGVHAVKTLEELRDGQSYICSDQKKVKPINLEMARKKLPPWYSARPVSARRRAIQLARQNMVRSARRENPLGVWTPKRLVVFRNGDPSMKHTVLLQRKTTQTFEALLDYMCEIMQFPVVKLYTADGRRVDGLPALILCSGAVVAAGREPFKSGNYDLLKPSLPTRLPATSSRVIPNRLQPKTRKKKSRSSSSKSRNFSLSSEKYFVNQIQNSITGSVYDLPSNLTGSVEMDPNTTLGSVEAETCTCAGDLGEEHHLVPPDDDIEKSFRVNQDGSMTVEMKVRLTIKEEETVHWSTTLTRSSVANQLNMACLTQPEQDSCTPDSSTVPSKDNDGLDPDGYESKDENNILPNENGPICEEEEDETYGAGSEAWQPTSRRAPTPGPRSIRKKQASVESIKMETETGIQENVVGTYSYTEETVEGKVTEECCIVRQCNSKPIPKPRNLGSMEINNNKLQSTIDPSGVSKILQMREHEEEITETVLHIYEQQSCHDNFFANTQFRVRSQCESVHGRPASTDTGLYSASNDFELDLRRPFTASESLSGRRAETLSLSSEPRVAACKNRTDLPTDYDIQTVANSERECAGSDYGKGKDSTMSQNFDKVMRKPIRPKEKQSFHSSLSPYKKKQKERNRDTLNKSKKEKTDISSPTDSEKQAEKSSQQKPGKRKKKRKGNRGGSGSIKNSKLPESMFSLNTEHSNSLSSEKGLSQIEEKSVRDQPVNKALNPEDLPLRKKVLDLLPPIESTHIKQVLTKQKSMNEDRSDAQELKELSESVSLPAPHSPPSVVNEYVEHWLKKFHPQPTAYMEGINSTKVNMEARVVFQIRNEEQAFPEENKTMHEARRPNTEEYYDSNVTERLIDGDPTIEKGEMASDDSSGEKQRHCISTESVNMKPGLTLFTHRSTEYLDIRHMLEKLSLSIQEIRQISEHRQPSCMEKSHSLPDFTSYVASTFGSSPQALLAFLSVMTLKEGISNTKTNEPLANNTSCTEALKMMESLKKISSIEDADELKASLSDLQKSTSSQLLQNWKSFQELSDKAQNHRLSSNFEHELSFETCQDQSYRNEEHPFDIQELVEELSTNTKLQEELSTLVNRKTSDVNMSEVPMENSEINDTAESYPGERVNHLKESGVEEETINFIESNFEQEVGDYVKSIIQNVTSALIVDTGSTVRVGTKKADFSALQQAEISKEPEGCTEEPVDQEKKQEGHEEEHNIYEEGTDRYAEQPLCYDEKQGNFIEHSAICQGEELIHENGQWTCEVEQGSYVEEEVCCAEQSGCVEEQAEDPEKQKSNEKERASYVEEQVSYDAEEASYVEQTGFVEEQKNDTGNKCSHEEQLAIQAHCLDKQCIYEEEQGYCQEDQGRSVKEQESKTEWPSSQDEQQLSPDEEQNCHENDHNSCVEELAKHFNYEEEQNSYVNKHISYEKNESTYKEEKAACIGEQESFTEQCPTYVEKQSSYEDKQDSKDEQQAMHDEEQVRHMEEHFCYVEENQPNCEEEQVNESTPHMHTTHSTEGSNQLNLVTEEAIVEDECVWNNVSQSVKILEELNNSLHPAPSASSLAFSYDSKGSLKREFEGTRVKSIRDLFLARSNVDFQYGHKQLPSPNTSDLSDYRPETSDSGGYRSQASLDTSTESGEDESGRRSIAKGYVRRTIERLYGRNDTAGKRPPSGAKAKRENRPGSNSVGSLTAFHEAKAKVITDLSYFNATSLYTTCNEPTQCIALKTNVDTKEGVLIDKGRWLLKENHLIRKSPPEDSAMQENGDSMSVETGPGYASDAAPYSHFGSHNPPLAVISSPELEDPGKTAVPNCTYFSLPHGSDSELFQDDLNVKTKSSTKAAKKDFQLSPATEEPKVCIEKNGSLPSFASVEFKKTGNKVHPQSGAPVVVTQPTRAQGATNSRAVQEQDPLEMLYLMCGQHCPIL
ncbi:oxygen-regulated protein 1-like [Anguilla rostrata]|uniref:oxygen-regulated protein 1-like n=1 Tax=Anguilla rostrata TaxID=7938 RepID=UPI0030D3DEDE